MTTREQIITAAKEAGFEHWDQFPNCYKQKLEALYAIGYESGRASRDAEVAELKNDATDFHGQVNRLTEWNNNLVSHRDELKSELFDLTKQRDALSRIADTLEQERDQLREQVTTLRALCMEGANGFGRLLISTGDDVAVRDWQTRCKEALDATEPKEKGK